MGQEENSRDTGDGSQPRKRSGTSWQAGCRTYVHKMSNIVIQQLYIYNYIDTTMPYLEVVEVVVGVGVPRVEVGEEGEQHHLGEEGEEVEEVGQDHQHSPL